MDVPVSPIESGGMKNWKKFPLPVVEECNKEKTVQKRRAWLAPPDFNVSKVYSVANERSPKQEN
jgi:hypothetical protein